MVDRTSIPQLHIKIPTIIGEGNREGKSLIGHRAQIQMEICRALHISTEFVTSAFHERVHLSRKSLALQGRT